MYILVVVHVFTKNLILLEVSWGTFSEQKKVKAEKNTNEKVGFKHCSARSHESVFPTEPLWLHANQHKVVLL
jgi:hypothetical protein